MRLILIRHAAAEARDSSKYPDDSQRSLTPKGRKRQRRVIKSLAKTSLTFDFLITSPYVRAVQTAEITTETAGFLGKVEQTPILADEFSPAAVINYVSQFPLTATVALVGHEPSMSALASELLSGGDQMALWFKKSGVMLVDFDAHPAPRIGRLVGYVTPALVKKSR